MSPAAARIRLADEALRKASTQLDLARQALAPVRGAVEEYQFLRVLEDSIADRRRALKSIPIDRLSVDSEEEVPFV